MEMTSIRIQQLNPAFTRPHPSNIAVYDVEAIQSLVPYKAHEHRMVEFLPRSFAANHKHHHQETMCASGGELTLYYLDDGGVRQRLIINPEEGTKLLVTVPSMLPHVLIDHSNYPAMLMYWTDIKPVEAIKMDVFDIHTI